MNCFENDHTHALYNNIQTLKMLWHWQRNRVPGVSWETRVAIFISSTVSPMRPPGILLLDGASEKKQQVPRGRPGVEMNCAAPCRSMAGDASWLLIEAWLMVTHMHSRSVYVRMRAGSYISHSQPALVLLLMACRRVGDRSRWNLNKNLWEVCC